MGLMGEAVELGTHLADFAGDDFLVASAGVGAGVHERAFGQ